MFTLYYRGEVVLLTLNEVAVSDPQRQGWRTLKPVKTFPEVPLGKERTAVWPRGWGRQWEDELGTKSKLSRSRMCWAESGITGTQRLTSYPQCHNDM